MSDQGIALTPEQRAAIFTPGNLIVRAGAGSGKTEVLARRFVALVAGEITGERISPAAIAAITFNEKAALEMRLRIAAVLDEKIAAAAAEDLAHLRRARRSLPYARISTIHAFCARILREHPLEAQLDPDFQVLDEYESATLFERIGRAQLIEAIRAGDAGAEFLMRARRMSSYPREGALEIVQRVYLDELRRSGGAAEELVELTEAAARRRQARAGEVAELAQELVTLVDELLKESRGNQAIAALAEFWPGARRRVSAIDSSSPPAAIEVLRGLCERMPSAAGRRSAAITAIRELATDKEGGRFGLGGRLIEAWGEYRASGPTRDTARLIAEIGEAYERALQAESALTFDDLLSKTRDLLRDEPTVGARYRNELSALLVDEYQDTNGLQDAIVEHLTTASGAGAAPMVFIVGDEKQSIYRFRGADVRVIGRERRSAPVEKPLTENRRSTPNILNFVNGLSASMFAGRADAARDYAIAWREKYALRPAREAAGAAITIIAAAAAKGAGGKRRSATAKRRVEAAAIAALIRGKIGEAAAVTDRTADQPRPAQYGDIAVLFRAFSDIAIYEQALLEAGIPCYTVNGRGFYGRREVIDLIELLTAINDPDDALALSAALRAPFFALSDDCLLQIGLRLHDAGVTPRLNSIAELFAAPEPDFSWLTVEREAAARAAQILRELRLLRGRVSLPEVIERALELTDYETVMAGLAQGRQRVANLRKLIELARQFDARRFFTFHDFTVYLRRLVETEPYEPQAQLLAEDENAVRLMTVHQAKGLEFPIVILADIGRRSPNLPESIHLDPAHGLILRATDGSGYDEIPNAALERYRENLKDEEEAEARRIFYVGLTRARDQLIISEGAGDAGWVKLLRAFLAEDDRAARAASGAIELKGGARIVIDQADQIALRASAAAAPPADPVEFPPIVEPPPPIIAGRPEIVISPTALADFARCPRQYWFRQILGLPEDHGAQGGDGGAAMGSVAHEVLERINFGLGGGAAREYTSELTERIGAAAGLTPEGRAQIARDLVGYLEHRRAGETIVARELPFMLNPADNFFIRGQIDVLIDDGAGGLLVRDYKYAAAAETARYEVQLQTYALAVMARRPGTPVRAEIVTLRGRPQSAAIALPAAAALRARIARLGEELESAQRAREYPSKPPDRSVCRALGCGYIARCWSRTETFEPRRPP